MSYLISPFKGLNQLNRELNTMFDAPRITNLHMVEKSIDWTPQVDLAESKEAIHLVADIPGVNPDDIEINLNNGTLTIKGERYTEEEVKENECKRIERHRGAFLRKFNLPKTVDIDSVSAKSSHGVLKITIPKASVEKPIKIAVEAG